MTLYGLLLTTRPAPDLLVMPMAIRIFSVVSFSISISSHVGFPDLSFFRTYTFSLFFSSSIFVSIVSLSFLYITNETDRIWM